MNFNDFSNVTIGGNSYRINFWVMNKGEPVDRTKSPDLSEKRGQVCLWRCNFSLIARYSL